MSSFSMDRSRCAAERALRSRTASRRSNFFFTPISFGLRKGKMMGKVLRDREKDLQTVVGASYAAF